MMVQTVLHLVVWYIGPGQTLDPNLAEESQALINLERNIANLERSLSTSHLGRHQNGSNQSLNTTGVDGLMSRTKYHTTQETGRRR